RDERVEALEVQRPRLDAQAVARRLRLEDSLAERLAQVRDEDLHRLRRRCGRALAPELVDEPRRRHDLVRAQEQDPQQRALLRSAERDLATVLPDGQWPEDAEFQRKNVTSATNKPQAGSRA